MMYGQAALKIRAYR